LINTTKQVPTTKNGDEVVAKVDGKKFTANDLYQELKKQNGQGVLVSQIDNFITEKETDDEDKKEANDYADGYIENLKAQYESYKESFPDALAKAGFNSEEAFKKEVSKQHLTSIVAEGYVKENNFKDNDIKKYYNDSIEGSMVVRYILIQPKTKEGMTPDETSAAEKEALKEANEVLAKLKKDGDFAELAKKHSDDATTASEGGLYSGFTKNEVVEEFWKAATALKDGKYTTEPVQSSYGYFIIKRVKQNEKPSLKDSKEDILDALLKKATAEDTNVLAKAWVNIRKKYNLNIVDTDIKNNYENVVKGYQAVVPAQTK
ncbi:MAG: peptidylprolyl isomerase, partial [Bacilli bacterium]